MSPYCHNPPPGTTPNAKIRIRTTYAAASCDSVAKSPAKMSKNAAHATLAALRIGFSLILGLGSRKSYPDRSQILLFLFLFLFLLLLLLSTQHKHNMKMKTLTLITAIAATAITSVLSAENDDTSRGNIYVNNERFEKQINYSYRPIPLSTREIRLRRGERRQRETEVKTAEFADLASRVQMRLEAKFGSPAEALKQHGAIKYDCYFHAREFCTRYNEPDSATRAYEMQEYVMAGLQEKVNKIASQANKSANMLAAANK
jgi:uncharacterized protein YxeA